MDSSLNRKVPLKWSSCIYILVLKSNYKKNSLWYFENKERSLCLGKHKKKPCFHFVDIEKEKILRKVTARTHCSENISQASYFDFQKKLLQRSSKLSCCRDVHNSKENYKADLCWKFDILLPYFTFGCNFQNQCDSILS